MGWVSAKSDPARIKGYKGHELEWNDDLKEAKSNSNSYTANIDSSSVKLFEKFIIECINKDIGITLVYAPGYIEGQPYVKNRKSVIAQFQYFSDKYNLDFIDYSKDEICFQKKLFYNSGHLNKNGSEMFTNKLTNDLKVRTNNQIVGFENSIN